MKNNKLKSLIKANRKSTKETIRLGIVAQLKDTATKFGLSSKKIDKEIDKTSKKLAKKLAAEVKVDKDALAKTLADAKPAAAPAKPAGVKIAKDGAAQPAKETAAV